MIRLRELLQQVIEARTTKAAGILAQRAGLTKLPGFGNYGVGNYVTHRSIKGQLKPISPHRLGARTKLSGLPEPTIRPRGGAKTPAE